MRIQNEIFPAQNTKQLKYLIILGMIDAAYHEKPLIINKAALREKLVSHHQAVNINL